jgi:hypothetical protein
MQRNEPERRHDRRKNAERDADQSVGGQPRPGDEEDESLQKPESTPSFLTARELQAKEPAKSEHHEKRQPGQKRGDD